MAQYRDELEAARHRVDTLKAQVDERDASLRARDAELAEQRAENERLRKGGAPPAARSRSMFLVVALALTTAIGAMGYAYGNAMSRRAALEVELTREREAVAREREQRLVEQERAEQARAEAARAEQSVQKAPPTPPALPYEPSGNATLNINSIPVSNVVLDGRPLGSTPKVGVAVTAGTHEVTFIHPELGKRSVLVEVKAGETRTAAVKFK